MTYKIPEHMDDEQAIMPAQWVAMLKNPHAIPPEKRLWLAVIEDAFRVISNRRAWGIAIDARTQSNATKPHALEWWRAYDWLTDLESHHLGSLVWLCESVAGLHDDPFTIAKRIADKVRIGESFAVMPRRPVVATQKVGLVWRRSKRRA